MKTEELEDLLKVGTKIKIGKKYSKEYGFNEGEIITLVDGVFEVDNGLYTENQDCPSIWNEEWNEFDSIYHLFGNNFEYWMDNTIIK
jgi:hypothetical protein